MTRPIFRAAALERLSSPEQLDRLMAVSSPRGWVALTGLGLLFLAALGWGLFGSVYSTVEGQGILILRQGVKSVVAPQAGIVSSVLVRPGDKVSALQRLVQLDFRLMTPRASPPVGSPGTAQNGEKKEPPPPLPAPDVELPATREAPFLVSTYTGRVLEVFVQEGSVVEKGTVLVTLEPPGDRLQALLYIPVGDGQKVRPGMRVDIAPSTAKKSEFGYLIGTVTRVERFPASHKAMMRILENEELVKTLTRGSPCLQIAADLVPDPDTVSGYRWSSSKGPPALLYSGTPCRALVTVREQAPVRLVVPALRDLMGF
jgi:biotin carboxyl carrier protein